MVTTQQFLLVPPCFNTLSVPLFYYISFFWKNEIIKHSKELRAGGGGGGVLKPRWSKKPLAYYNNHGFFLLSEKRSRAERCTIEA